MGFDGLCKWVKWEKVALGVFLPSGWDLMDGVSGLVSISCPFAILFNWNLTLFSVLINFPCYSMGSLHFVNFPCYSMGI